MLIARSSGVRRGAIQDELESGLDHLMDRFPHGRERRRAESGGRNVVESRYRDVLGDPQPDPLNGLKKDDGVDVVPTHDRGRPVGTAQQTVEPGTNALGSPDVSRT